MKYSDIDKDDYSRDYTEDKQIDKFNLDEECCNQADIFDYWIRLEKFAAGEVDEIETNLAALKSKVELEVKGMDTEEINKVYKLSLSENDKITDKIATNIRRQDKRVKELIRDFNSAKHNYRIAYAARMSFQTKKEMLDNLTKLHGQGYFSKVEGKSFHESKINGKRKQLKRVIGETRYKKRVKDDN